MYKPLVIAHDFLFPNSPGGQIERSFWSELSKDGFSPKVFCSDKGDANLFEIKTQLKLTHEIRSIKYIAALVRRILPDLTYLPDYEYISWGINAKNVAIKATKKENFDYIHSISYPSSDHWCALKIKEKTGLPWVAQFHDPWYDNPFRRFKTKYLKQKDLKMEQLVVKKADIIIHNNEAIKELWKQRYGEEIIKKTIIIPLNVRFNSENINPNYTEKKTSITIAHIGNFYYNRKSTEFIKAVSSFVKQFPELSNKLKIIYIGDVMIEDKKLITELKLDNLFNVLGKVSEEICTQHYLNADIFLATAGHFNENIFFPSKILKYFYYRKPILGITPLGTVLDLELRKSGHHSFELNNTDGIVNYLHEAVINYQSFCSFNKDYWKKFSVDNVVYNYKLSIENMLINNKL